MSTRSGRMRMKEASPPRTRKGVSPPRSPARSRKSSPPARSPSRKSPSRKSPSRKSASKFPARKSPSRSTKETTESAPQNSPGKRPTIKSNVTVNLQDVSKLDIFRSTRGKSSDYGNKDSKDISDKQDKVNGVEYSVSDSSEDMYGLRNRKPVEELSLRRSIRLKEADILPDIRRSLSKSLSKSISKSVSQSIDTYSDEDNSEDDRLRRKTESVTRKLATPIRESASKMALISSRWEFGGRIGSALLIIIVPLTIFSILLSCTKACTIKSLIDLNSVKSLSVWFSLPTLGIILAQCITQAFFSVVALLGPKADRMDESGNKFTFNAFFSSICTVNLLFLANYFGIYNNSILLREYLKLAVISYVIAVILSIILYVKSRKINVSDLNPYGNTGYALYDFCLGREIHPFIKKLDVKIWISKISNINTLILAILIFKSAFILPAKHPEDVSVNTLKEILSKVQLKPTVLAFSLMQIVYILNFIMKEHKITSTFFWHSEGLGYLQLVSSALYPFYFTTISKFVLDSELALSTNALISASVLYLLGFLIMLISNNIKHEFRKNPLHSSLSNLDAMPTFHGKKLLVSNLWGLVRHPNYTGDILIHAALALPGILSKHYIAAAPAVLTILLLIHRAWRDHSRCRRRYGSAWDRYCRRVPKVFIPKVL